MTLWIFGDSLSLPYNLDDPAQGWPEVLSRQLDMGCENHARPAVDNFYIYQCYLDQMQRIQPNDIVVIGWTHPNRKMFVLDRTNPAHTSALGIGNNYVYQSGGREFMRGKNNNTDTVQKWKSLVPTQRQNPFYDTWFTNYFSNYEHVVNLKSYADSARHTCPGRYVEFFFSKESVGDFDLKGCGYMLEFIMQSGLSISNTDCHLNAQGHKAWADIVCLSIQTNSAAQTFPVIELVDRYAIAQLKFDKTKANLQELNFYNSKLKNYDLDLIAEDLDQLYHIHSNIWSLEAELKSGREQNLSLEELGRRAILIRDWNHQRIELKNSMAKKLGCEVREIKKDHLSQGMDI